MGLITASTPTESRKAPPEVDADGPEFEFRRLTGHQLDEAEEEATKKALRLVSQLPAESVAAMQNRATREALGVKRRELSTYDADLLIRYGLVGWPYPEPCDDEHKALLDVRCRDWCADVITEMNVVTEGEGPSSGGNSRGDTESLLSSPVPTASTGRESS